jgi:hypothetical protein
MQASARGFPKGPVLKEIQKWFFEHFAFQPLVEPCERLCSDTSQHPPLGNAALALLM